MIQIAQSHSLLYEPHSPGSFLQARRWSGNATYMSMESKRSRSLHGNESFGLRTGFTNLLSQLAVSLRCSNDTDASIIL